MDAPHTFDQMNDEIMTLRQRVWDLESLAQFQATAAIAACESMATTRSERDRLKKRIAELEAELVQQVERDWKDRAWHEKRIAELEGASRALVEIVEGVPSVRWAYEGCRFKDTPEWARFYVMALKGGGE